ncbi:hypothetical protein EU348_15805 [Chryseobacterium indologenes]|uniref:Uncharacterized protein n=1 Tax=Chryseobacterium indologenes TaxID=253 RepID=A0A411DQA2_CHRID|nr:hypothetical protein EU348_15805 [Chryseobacterium indologenes]
MKKKLFTALLFAGATLGFAKDNVQKNEVKTTTAKEVKQVVKAHQINSIEEDLLKATCTDIHAFFDEVDGELEYQGSMEISYECDNAEVSLYIWY